MAPAVPPPLPDFRALFEATPSPYLVLTPQLTIAAVNDAYLQATRRTRADLLGRNLFDAFPDNPDDPGASGVRNLRQSLERVLRGRTTDTIGIQRYDIQVDDGRFEERYWSPVNTPVLAPDGSVAHIIHRVEDVTAFVRQQSLHQQAVSTVETQELEIRSANQRLHRSQLQAMELAREAATQRQRLQAVLEAVPTSVFVVSSEGVLVRVNAASARLWGPMPSRVGEQLRFGDWKARWADGSARDGRPLADDEWPLARALRGELVRDETIEVQTFDPGTPTRIALTSAAPVRNAEGDVIGAVVVSMDVSERVRAEQALREANRRKDEFLAMLAHELRNPLAPIRSAADLLAMPGFDTERLRQTSSIIVRQVRHMTGLIDDLLDVSRVTRGLVRLQKERLDAKRILSDAAEQVRPIVDARGHRLTLHTTADPVFVLGDAKRLVQVVANILANAAKYTPEGGRIDATLESEDGRAVIRVRDNGIGMAPELLANAFELFVQGERTSDRAQGGLGIGLALVKSLVELHGGTVTAHSDGPGQGSTFVVQLPEAAGLASSAAHPASTPDRDEAARALRVLVVDDNADAAHMLALLLQAMGHDPVVEHDGLPALQRARSQPPQACLLDIGLPGMDGYELAKQLRSDPATRDALLVAVTGYGHEHDRQRALAAGFDHHLTKPVDAAVLAELLQEREA